MNKKRLFAGLVVTALSLASLPVYAYSEEIKVTCDIESSYSVCLPKKITLDGQTGKAEYNIYLDNVCIDENEYIGINGRTSMSMNQTGKEPIGGYFDVKNTVLTADYPSTVGEVCLDENQSLAGEWEGTITFEVGLFDESWQIGEEDIKIAKKGLSFKPIKEGNSFGFSMNFGGYSNGQWQNDRTCSFDTAEKWLNSKTIRNVTRYGENETDFWGTLSEDAENCEITVKYDISKIPSAPDIDTLTAKIEAMGGYFGEYQGGMQGRYFYSIGSTRAWIQAHGSDDYHLAIFKSTIHTTNYEDMDIYYGYFIKTTDVNALPEKQVIVVSTQRNGTVYSVEKT